MKFQIHARINAVIVNFRSLHSHSVDPLHLCPSSLRQPRIMRKARCCRISSFEICSRQVGQFEVCCLLSIQLCIHGRQKLCPHRNSTSSSLFSQQIEHLASSFIALTRSAIFSFSRLSVAIVCFKDFSCANSFILGSTIMTLLAFSARLLLLMTSAKDP